MAKKKNLDERIELLKEKLKQTEELKKQSTQRKGRNLWNKLKTPFTEREILLDILLNDKDKLEVFKKDIDKSLKKLFPDIFLEKNNEENKEMKDEPKF